MDYPDYCIRGVVDEGMFRQGQLGSELFHFKGYIILSDGWAPESISWQDDDRAFEVVLNQKKERKGKLELQFRAGIAMVPRAELDSIRRMKAYSEDFEYYSEVFDYNREPQLENPYHGNLLLRQDMLKAPIMGQIAGRLAMASQFIPRSKFESK